MGQWLCPYVVALGVLGGSLTKLHSLIELTANLIPRFKFFNFGHLHRPFRPVDRPRWPT